MNRNQLILLLLAAIISTAVAYRVKGHIKTSNEWNFIGQFVFTNGDRAKQDADGHGITINYQANVLAPHGLHYWVFYYDVPNSWAANYKNDSRSCIEKVRGGYNRAVNMTGHKEVVHPHDSMRPHIWYVVLLNCPAIGMHDTIDVSYDVSFIDIDGTQEGFDQRGMLELNATYFCLYLVLLTVHCCGLYFLWLKKSMHAVVQALGVTLATVVVSLFFVMLHWAIFHNDGMGCVGCRVFGQLVFGVSSVMFATLLVMISSGWAITYHTLPRKWWVLGLFVGYLLAFLLFFIISTATSTNPSGSTQLVYSSGALLGLVIIYILVCWLGVFGYFAYSLYLTFREETQYDKRLFYIIFGIGYGMWFILPAMLNFISMGIAEWYRPKVVDAFQLTATFIGMLALVVLLWPSRAEKFFRVITPDLLYSNPDGM